MDRLLSITMLLLDKKRISAKELAEKFEVSPRTIYRDIDTLNMAGIPIRSTSGVGGGFEIMENYKMDKKSSPLPISPLF
ncbi:HTH domain-containing protein [Enterococcus avium]